MSEKALAVAHDNTPALTRGPRLSLPTQAELDTLLQYGGVIVKSGMAPAHIKTAEAALVIMRYGHQLGVDEFTALQNMFVIGGKPAATASLMHAVILRDHGGDAIQIVESNGERCLLRCKRRDSRHSADIGYSLAEAKQAGLVTNGGTWTKYPADLLFARAVSRAGRQMFRDSTMGMYTPEEIGGDIIEVQGEIVEVASPAASIKELAADYREEQATASAADKLRERAKRANAAKDGPALQQLVKEAGDDLNLWAVLISESGTTTQLEWLRKKANGKAERLKTHFDARAAALAQATETGDVAVEENQTLEVIPDHILNQPQMAGMAAARNDVHGR
jgi:hypothetical protein